MRLSRAGAGPASGSEPDALKPVRFILLRLVAGADASQVVVVMCATTRHWYEVVNGRGPLGAARDVAAVTITLKDATA